MRIYSTFFYFLLSMTVMSEGVSQEFSSIPAEKHIENLKTGVLLVKLNTQSLRINHRIKSGKIKRAELLKKEVEKEHYEIMAAFKKYYKFSDYYFFYSDDSHSVIDSNNFDLLFDSNMVKIDSFIDIGEKPTYLLMLGVPPGYPGVHKYHFLLSYLSDNGRRKIPAPMPRSFKTNTRFWFDNGYDFDRAVERIDRRFHRFLKKLRNSEALQMK